MSVFHGVSLGIMAKREGENWGYYYAMMITAKLSVLGAHMCWESNICTVISVSRAALFFLKSFNVYFFTGLLTQVYGTKVHFINM